MLKFNRRGSRSTYNEEPGHFTFLIFRGQQRNVRRFRASHTSDGSEAQGASRSSVNQKEES